ncbi:hypothetical protein ZIOFF_010441 [Zingiber officinale]|uniref:Binding protein n=1 Tax=Zingiber officinale TaxID=94328 RepID=A0A8J5LPC8_ZINOF|nr:hypothetical protein ZIOFF_010441 [Zingiber officinale]
MQKYLSLRQTYQEDASELHKRIFVCFKSMSRLFNDPMNAEENFQFLNQLKDDELLKILGEKHPLYDFMDTLTLKCSYILFNKEFVKETLSEAAAQHSAGNTKLISSSMNLLTVISGYSPLLLAGCEEDLLLLLKEDNDLVKEGIAHVLAKAGGTIREQLTMASSSVELLLERLCLEGTRKQAKYSVQALAAITKDDGLKSLSVLYKRLVDILEEKSHLPSILQSLGCIAQTAMPIFETREDEITEFITSKILHNSNKSDEVSFVNTEWSEISELCLTKMFGIKTLVKSYIPAKDAHMRPGIEKLLEILQKIFSYGEISEEIRNVDKAHMRLASAKAVLRLSRYWDQKITTSLFYWTLRISQDAYAESKKSFLNKVHQYIKERLLDAKYACAFLLNFNDCHCPEYEEVGVLFNFGVCKQSLLELVHMCRQVKMRQLSTQSDLSSAPAYPEYILAYTVHALAHDPSCPNIDECLNVQAFEHIYWRLHLLLSLLLHGDDGKQSGAFPIERKESYYTILSIFHSIKNAKDVVDETKSNALYAICYLGLSILKRLVPDEVQVSGFDVIPLPNMLYRAVDCSNNYSMTDDNKWTWLNSDSVLAHFEALRLKNKKMGDSLVVEDGMVVEENGDDNEVPLGKMMEILRNQGVKKKKKKKKDIFTNLETINSEFDVLGVVREINLESFKQTQDREAIVSDHNCRSGKQNGKVNTEKEISSLSKRQRDAIGFEVLAPTPKRKRSISTNRLNSSKGRKGNTKRSPIQSLLEQSLFEDDRTETETDLLITYATDISSMKGRKVSDALHIEKDVDSSSEKLTLGEDNKKKDYQSRTSSTKKRKRRSIARLEKCTSLVDQSSESELVGSRIRIWWPLDKRFYQGVVHSYDPGNKKHTILYDDGDVEVLLLSKENWEIINNTLSAGKVVILLYSFVCLNVCYLQKIDRSSSKAKKKGSTIKRVEENSKLVSVSNNNLDLSPSSNDELKDLRIDQSEYDDAKSDGPQDEEVTLASQSEEEVKAEELHESSKEEIESPKLTDAKDDSDNEPIVR